MKAHWCISLVVVGIILALTWAAAAAAPLPPGSEAEQMFTAGVTPDFPGFSQPSADRPLTPRFSVDQPAKPDAQTPAIALGQPGLSFRYTQTFGVTEQAYIADVQHLNSPAGLFMDAANNLYVVEDQGNRVLKFNAAGNNLMSIGTAGLFVRGSYTFNLPRDAAVDNSGNLWVVDSHRAVQYSATGTYLQELPQNDPWQSGNDNTHFNEPYGIAFDLAGRMFIADSSNHRVQVYTFSGGKPVYSATIGVTGVTGNDNAHFNTPYRLAVDSSGGLYVVDNRNNRVQRCVLSGAWTCTTLDGGLNNPQGIAVDGNDNVYIAETGNSRIRKCIPGGACSNFANVPDWTTDLAVDSNGAIYASAQFRHVIRKFSSTGNLIGTHLGVEGVPYLTDGYHYNHPRVAIDGDDNIIVLEEHGQRLLKLNPAGALLWAVGEPGVFGNDNAHFKGPRGVAVGNDRRIYVADNCRVQIFSGDGSYMATLGTGCGTGDYQFGKATGIAVDDNDYIYVSDDNNHRVQIYDNNRVFVGRLGVTGQCGTENDRLCSPRGIEVDAGGSIYVADSGNARVQKFNSGRQWQMTIGTLRSWGNSFSQLNSGEDIAIDAEGRIYVADIWNNRVQVFDATGAYLTTIGGNYGNASSRFRDASGVDIDRAGNVYAADLVNGRIQKFAPGVPNWRQVNINGFGERRNFMTEAVTSFGDRIYVGTYNNSGNGAQLWRKQEVGLWEAIMTNGFGDPANNGVSYLIEFKNKLYAGTGNTNGGQLWRSDLGSDWNQVVSAGFGDATNRELNHLMVFDGMLYAATNSSSTTHGAEVWRSSTGNSNWVRVVSNGFGDARNRTIASSAIHQGYLYVGTDNWDSNAGTSGGGQIWRTPNGTDWALVNSPGFGSVNTEVVSTMEIFNGALYVGTQSVDPFSRSNAADGQIWRCAICAGSDWVSMMTNGFGDPNNNSVHALRVYKGQLYAVTFNEPTGMEVWGSANGTAWTQVNPDGFGDSNNTAPYWSNSVIVFNNRLYVGSSNFANGAELWLYQPKLTFLPLIVR